MNVKLAQGVALATLITAASAAQAADPSQGNDGRPAPTPAQLRGYTLGAAGLIEEYFSYDTFGTVQARIGQSRAEIEYSRTSGITSDYEDVADVAVLPINALIGLGETGTSFLRVGGVGSLNDGRADVTHVNAQNLRGDVQYVYSPDPTVLYAIGLFGEGTAIDLAHNDGEIDRMGIGIRADYVKKMTSNWGLAARAEYLFTENETRIPIAPGVTYALDQGEGRFYFQADLVGSYTHQDAAWIPEGWIVRPALEAVYQHSRFEDATDSFGATKSGTVGSTDQYATVAGSLRVEKAAMRPFALAPYVELGLEKEVLNDLDLIVDDPTIVHTVVGAGMNLNAGTRMDLVYSRHDGFEGERRDQALTLTFGLTF